MVFFAILFCCVLTIPASWATTLIGVNSEGEFCYRDDEGCGPSSNEWSPLCHTGIRQSPIDLPFPLIPTGQISLNFHAYRANSFRIQNNGHSIQFDFNNQSPSTQLFTFPDPLRSKNPSQREYKFAAGHFHWGTNDHSTGSEHCVGGKCSAMELHLVHYLASYPTMADAVASGDENALSVLGLLIDVNPLQTVGGHLMNFLTHEDKGPLAARTGALYPIAKNLGSVEHAEHDSSTWTTVNEPLDLGRMLFEALIPGPFMYTYKGSLTTPGCNEQVNWYVLSHSATAFHQELEAFRTIVKDGRNETLTANHRPLQAKNGRKVLLSAVFGY